jgi:hypothetical protein
MTGVPMARGHLYLRNAGGVSAGMKVGRGTAPESTLSLIWTGGGAETNRGAH